MCSVRRLGCSIQVSLDWTRGRTQKKGVSGGDKDVSASSRMQRLWDHHMSTGATPTAREQQRVAGAPNVMALLGHDHALRVGMGLALADFKPAAALLPLGPDQKRYVVDASALPGDVLQRGEKQRVCIEDVSSGKRRLECPASLATSCRTLHLRVDQGSIGWPAAHFLFTRGGICGSFFWDPAHRFHNDVRGALVASDLWMKVIECTMAFNMPQGPWSKASFFRKACQCADDFFITQNEHHPPPLAILRTDGLGFGPSDCASLGF